MSVFDAGGPVSPLDMSKEDQAARLTKRSTTSAKNPWLNSLYQSVIGIVGYPGQIKVAMGHDLRRFIKSRIVQIKIMLVIPHDNHCMTCLDLPIREFPRPHKHNNRMPLINGLKQVSQTALSIRHLNMWNVLGYQAKIAVWRPPGSHI